LEEINSNYGKCVFKRIDFGSAYDGDWYYLKIRDLPEKNQINYVIYDIINNNDLKIVDSKVCSTSYEKRRKINNDSELNKIEEIIKDKDCIIYDVIIYDSKKNDPIYSTQPLVFICNPKIDVREFPYHKHLNIADIKGFRFGTTICYTDTPEKLGEKIGGRINETIFEIYLWLFRNKIWKSYFDKYNVHKWIGPQKENPKSAEASLKTISPNSRCKCGSNYKYGNCCFSKDIKGLKGECVNINLEKMKYASFVERQVYPLEEKIDWFYDYLRK